MTLSKLNNLSIKIACFIGLFACSVFAQAERTTIASASSLRLVAEKLAKEYQIQLQNDAQFAISSASSGTLAAQIKEGAPFEIFFSAGSEYSNSVNAIQVSDFAEAQLVIASKNLIEMPEALKDKSIAIANPSTAPVGEAGWQYIEKHHLQHHNKIVRANNAQLAFQMLERDLVDVALVSSVQLAGQNFHTHPSGIKGIKQQIVLVKETTQAKAFYDFVLSGQANHILEKSGFSLIKAKHNELERDDIRE